MTAVVVQSQRIVDPHGIGGADAVALALAESRLPGTWCIAPQGGGVHLVYRIDWDFAWRGDVATLIDKIEAERRKREQQE